MVVNELEETLCKQNLLFLGNVFNMGNVAETSSYEDLKNQVRKEM